LHTHISRIHKIPLAEYYVNFYQKKDKHTGKLLPFTNKTDYFDNDFSCLKNFEKWAEAAEPEEVREYMLRQLKSRIESKKLEYAPSHLELKLHGLPSLDIYKKHFGSYSKACSQLNIEPLYNKNLFNGFFDDNENVDSAKILIDTREQRPLSFPKSSSLKLDFGDYAVGSSHYDYTYVDRKSEGDFKSTMTTGFDRFIKEMERVIEFDAYLFIVTESSINKIKKNNIFGPHESNLPYVWHNMRIIAHKFPRRCQFIFSGSRSESEALIPKLLVYGRKLWGVDLQYFLDH
tara:strand:+ start:1971 stop:2837 length:867 start_codon:yes stop_codon:yes gene_type:complete